MRFPEPPGGVLAPQLYREIRDAGIECQGVHHNPHEGWVEIDADDDRVTGALARHVPDPGWNRTPEERELLRLLRGAEVGALTDQEQQDLVRLERKALRRRLEKGEHIL